MINLRKISYLVIILLFLFPVFVFAQTPPGVDIPLDYLLDLTRSLAGFLIIAGMVLVGITLVATGIVYLMSGGNSQKVAGAKNMFKAGLIGALIIFAPGVIISTVTGFGTNPLGFFGGGGGGGGGPTSTNTPTPAPTTIADITYGCNANNQCVVTAGGIYADTTCANQCTGAGGAATSSACYDCTNQGQVWCLATASCIANELNCPGVFTRDPGGCP